VTTHDTSWIDDIWAKYCHMGTQRDFKAAIQTKMAEIIGEDEKPAHFYQANNALRAEQRKQAGLTNEEPS
jgi:hypothetical protein